MNDYYICVRRFVVSDPELPDSLYMEQMQSNTWKNHLFELYSTMMGGDLSVHQLFEMEN